jgi:pimeloyl-ACP methyl ester carboxylesterase
MAADAVGLLDHLGIERAHVMGASMGGMIAQTMAIKHPDRVRSLISVMSQPGEPDVGQPTERAIAIFSPPPTSRQEYIDSSPRGWCGSRRSTATKRGPREGAARGYDRSFYPEGAPRQMAAIVRQRRPHRRTAQLDVPTLVIHGRDDSSSRPSGGFRTAELIPGAHLLFLADMGHDMPEPLWPLLVDASTQPHLGRLTPSPRPPVRWQGRRHRPLKRRACLDRSLGTESSRSPASAPAPSPP